MWNEVIDLFREYMGTGLIMICFLISLIYLWVNETRKYIRILFLYLPVIFLLLYFNPLFAALVYGLADREIYYRILWLLPVTVVIAYTCVHIYGKLQGAKQGLFAVCALGVIVVSGSYIYANPYFAEAENIYHVPDTVVEICDVIHVPGREVRAAFPEEYLQYVRQYDPTICMPYGREVLVENWWFHAEMYDVMEAEVIDWERLAALAKETQCHYVIQPAGKPAVGDPENYELIWFGQIDGYAIYRNVAMELIIPRVTVEE